MLSDVRHAVRSLVGNPGFFAAAVVTLALGIGANAAMFTVVREVLLRPLPYAEPDRLVKVWETWASSRNVIAPANFADWRARSRSFDGLAAFVPDAMNLSELGDAARVQAVRVSAEFFDVLGVAPLAGRGLTADDVQANARVVMVRESFWRTRLNGEPGAVGRTLQLDGERYEIVGVVPDRVEQPSRQTDIWRPLIIPARQTTIRGAHYLQAIGRLRRGVTLAQAHDEMTGIGADLQRENPVTNARVGAGVFSLEEELTRDTRRPLLLVFGATAIVLLIACVNVAHLLLARGSGRRVELAVRAALGASRGRIVRQLVTESAVLAAAGGAGGLFLAMWGAVALRAGVPDALADVRRATVDGSVLAFTFVVAVVTSLVFGVIPAFRLSTVSLDAVMRAQARNLAPRRAGGRVLIAVQVALAVVLVVGAGLLLVSFARLRSVDPGFDTSNLVVARIALPEAGYPTGERKRRFFRQVLDRLNGLTGVDAAAAATRIPLRAQSAQMTFTVDTTPPFHIDGVLVQEMSPEYVRALRLHVLQGRTLVEADSARQGVAMISRAFARRAFGDADPLGRRFRMGPTYINDGNPWLTVVGVIDDVRQFNLALNSRPQVYLPYGHTIWMPSEVVVRASLDPAVVFEAIRSAVRDIDRNQPVTALYTMRDVIDQSVSSPRFNALLVGLFAALALSLALVGIYGVIAYSVGQRTLEIGIRVALGARRADVLRLIGGEGLVVAAIGLVSGLAGAAALSRALEGMLFGITPFDPSTYGAAAIVTLAAAAAACLVPTLRATRLDPARVLRSH